MLGLIVTDLSQIRGFLPLNVLSDSQVQGNCTGLGYSMQTKYEADTDKPLHGINVDKGKGPPLSKPLVNRERAVTSMWAMTGAT